MKVTPTELPEVLTVDPDVYPDHRGYLMETYQSKRYDSVLGAGVDFVQDNLSFSRHGVLRGLHYQLGRPQAKLVTVLDGRVFDVAADIRIGSPTFGRWVGVELSSDNHRQIFVPAGFAHGFCVLSESAVVLYKCSDFYAPSEERGVLWNCPALAIRWPCPQPVLSQKDMDLPTLEKIERSNLPMFHPVSSGRKL